MADFHFPPSLAIPLGAIVALALLLLLVARVPLKYNLRNLTVRWKTTLMTAAAFTAVISLLIVMLAFVNGMTRLTEGSGRPDNVMILSEGSTDEAFSNLGFSDIGDIENQPGVLRARGAPDGPPLCSRETYLVVNQPIENPQPGRPRRRFVQLRGIDDAAISSAVHGLPIYPGGEWFSPAGVAEIAGENGQPATVIQAVLGEGVARELGRDRSPAARAQAKNPARLDVGDKFTIGGRTWLIVGVMQSGGTTFDSEIWARRSVIGPLFGKNIYTTLVVRAADPEAAKRLSEFFAKGYTKAPLAPRVETEYFASLSATNRQFLYAINFVSLVMAIGGAFGVMNTMFAAVSQRVKDIGVLRLVGFGRGQILVSFLLESLMIAAIGGAAGCALGSLVDGWSATSIVSSNAGGGKTVILKLAVDAQVLASGMLLALGMGIAGGVIPALTAVRLRALDALR